MKKNYYCYRATVTFSGSVGAESEEQAIEKVIAESKRLPETVSFKESEVKVRKLQKKPEKGLYHDTKYEW
jgi:hypothetical protein|tara:strand:+ start:3560 stop:3769 length:210 start_codon:yes stop_codon:yes gene_type:complete